jgi:ABC-type sugar transport system substrate-binding protein
MTINTPQWSRVSRRSLMKGLAGAATLAVPTATILKPARVAYAADKKVTVGMAWPGMQDAVWSTSKTLLESLAAQSNPPIELVFTAADMDVAKQASDVKDLISKGIDVLLVFPIDSKAISSSVRDAHEAKIPVMSFLRQVHADAKYQADVFVGIDAKWQEYSSAKSVFTKMQKNNVPVKGILWVSGDLRDENSRLRGVGLQEAAKEFNATILQDLPANWDPLQAAAVLAPALKAYPDANVLAIASDVMISGVQKVLQDANKWYPFPDPNHMYFISVDVFPIGLQLLREKYLDADTLFDVKGMCQKAVEYLPKLAAGEKLKDVLIQGPVYTQENVDDPGLQAQLWAK